MPRIAYMSKNFKDETLDIIQKANAIAAAYSQQGYDLTLRQVYYQFVARGWMANSDRNYKKLGNVVNDARMAGYMDWNYITDRTRYLRRLNVWASPSDIITASAAQFRRNLWAETGQQYRPEVWVEKDALVGVIGKACEDLHVPFMSCRGYMSQSEMWTAGRRMKSHFDNGVTPIVIHLGDHDPSGLDMTRDIADRLWTFAEQQVTVVRIALNMNQINQYNPPPNPAKLTDSRGQAYVDQYGPESWELDALNPTVLDSLIRAEVAKYVDQIAWDVGEEDDQDTRDQMDRIAQRWDDLDSEWDAIEDLLDGNV